MPVKKELDPVARGLVDGLKLRLCAAFDKNPDITAEEFASDAVPHSAQLFTYLPEDEPEKMARALISLAVRELKDEMHSARSPK